MDSILVISDCVVNWLCMNKLNLIDLHRHAFLAENECCHVFCVSAGRSTVWRSLGDYLLEAESDSLGHVAPRILL